MTSRASRKTLRSRATRARGESRKIRYTRTRSGASLRAGTNPEPLIVGLHTNLFRTHIRTVAVTSASPTVTASSAIFSDAFTGKWIAIFGAGIGSRTFTASATFDLFTVSDHGFTTGTAITVSNSGGSLPVGLAAVTPYYVIVVSSSTFKLASSLLRARQGLEIDISTNGSGTNTVVVNYLIGKMAYFSTTQVTLTNVLTGAALNASASLSGLFALVGRGFVPVTPFPNTEEHTVNVRAMAIQNARSFCASVVQPTDAITGAIFDSVIFGTASQSSVIQTT